MSDRRLFHALGLILGLLLVAQLNRPFEPRAVGQGRATLEPTAAAATDTAIAALFTSTPTHSPTPTYTPSLTPTATCAPGPQCVYLTTLERQPAATATPTALPTPSVRVLSSRSYDESIFRYVVGEVRNDTGAPAIFVRVSVDWYNAEGVLVDTDFAYTMLDRLAPGQRSPFQILTSNLSPTAAYYVLRVAWRAPTGVDDVPVTVLSAVTQVANGSTSVVGQVRNDSGQPLSFVEVVVTFYNAGGEVVQVDFTYADPTDLAPGAVGAFKTFTSGDYSGFAVAVQAEGSTP